jgi:hypothetical protein
MLQVKLVGKQRLVLDLSCRQKDDRYWVVTDRWQRFSSLSLSEESLQTLSESCDEFLVSGLCQAPSRLDCSVPWYPQGVVLEAEPPGMSHPAAMF